MDIRLLPLDLDTPEEHKYYTHCWQKSFCSPVVYTRIQEDCFLASNELYTQQAYHENISMTKIIIAANMSYVQYCVGESNTRFQHIHVMQLFCFALCIGEPEMCAVFLSL